ncbi:MAG: hypothetical protein GEU71_13070 [Actinobacteria bacterium]|nr:hypothetical protein [Actinomycetota bacterium]
MSDGQADSCADCDSGHERCRGVWHADHWCGTGRCGKRGGGASASAVDLNAVAVDLVGGLIQIPGLAVVLSESNAPIGTYGVDSGDLLTLDVPPLLSTTEVSSASSRLPAGMGATAAVGDVDIDLLGLDLVTADVVSSESFCPPTGSVGVPTATANVDGLTVLGSPVDLSLGSVTLDAPIGIDLGGLATATMTVTVSQPIVETATTASASALLVEGNLFVEALGLTLLDAEVLNVGIANSACDQAAAGVPTILSLDPDFGPTGGGTVVTMSGTDFVPDETSVTFDGLSATVLDVSDDGTEVVTSTPPHPVGVVDVVVTTPGGTATLVDGFTYNEDEVPTSGPCSGRSTGDPTPGGGQFFVGTEGNDFFVGTPGDDIFCLGGGNDTASGGGGKDLMLGQGGNDTLSGGAGNDVLRGGPGVDVLKGNKGIDTLQGGKGSDTLQGGKGSDIMQGGRGNDTLRDTFGRNNVFNGDAGRDTCVHRRNRGNTIRNCEIVRRR